MKALFMSITAGQGHNTTSKALMEQMRKRGLACMMMDTYRYIAPFLGMLVDKGYVNWTRINAYSFGRFYESMDSTVSKDNYSMTEALSKILSKELISAVEDLEPDVIICSHVLTGLIATQLVRQGHTHAKTVGIITDFTIHPRWERTELDCYILAHESLSYQAQRKSLPKDILLPCGIPIFEKFASHIPQQEARRQKGLADLPTLLLLSGSMGFGNIPEVVKLLDELPMDFQIVCVCGNDKRKLQRLQELQTQKPLVAYGYVEDVDLLMDASDIVITKPGGLTCSEVIAKNLPLILVNPIPGVEDRNMAYLLNHGLAMGVQDQFPLDEAISQMLLSDVRIDAMRQMQRIMGKPHAAADAAEFIIHNLLEKGRSDA